MDFEEFKKTIKTPMPYALYNSEALKYAWDYQQERIDELEAFSAAVAKAAGEQWNYQQARIEELEEVAEWHKRRAAAWRDLNGKEGYVVVPVEPTEAIYNELEKHQWHGADSYTLYKVMIKAAQESE